MKDVKNGVKAAIRFADVYELADAMVENMDRYNRVSAIIKGADVPEWMERALEDAQIDTIDFDRTLEHVMYLVELSKESGVNYITVEEATNEEGHYVGVGGVVFIHKSVAKTAIGDIGCNKLVRDFAPVIFAYDGEDVDDGKEGEDAGEDGKCDCGCVRRVERTEDGGEITYHVCGFMDDLIREIDELIFSCMFK